MTNGRDALLDQQRIIKAYTETPEKLKEQFINMYGIKPTKSPAIYAQSLGRWPRIPAEPMDRREWTVRYFDHASKRMEEIDFYTAESAIMTHEEQANDAAYGIAGSNDYKLKANKRTCNPK